MEQPLAFNSLSNDVPYRVCATWCSKRCMQDQPDILWFFNCFLLNLLPARWQHRCVCVLVMSQTVALGISFFTGPDRNTGFPLGQHERTGRTGGQTGGQADRRSDGRTDGRLGQAAREWWTGVLYAGLACLDLECATSSNRSRAARTACQWPKRL
jgi:hypothetical protein